MFEIEDREVNAPGFSRESFIRAVERARADELYLGYIVKKSTVPVHNPNTGMTYLATRTSCSCMAGRTGRTCKHRAWALYHFDVLGWNLTRLGAPERTDRNWTIQRDAA